MVYLDDGSRREELFSMWQRIFHDTRPYTEYYFDEVYGHNEVLLEKCEEGLRGMLHLNPYELLAGEQTFKAHYIVGVSTEEEYRRQGVMRSLLKDAFSRLRNRGEAFTYLMPADEAYYLPFSFRFGMTQIEQEIESGGIMPEDAGFTFYRSTEMDLNRFSSLENEWKRRKYGLTTKVSAPYFEKMEKEVRSEFGCFFYAMKDGEEVGRFVVYAEDDFLSISQLSCFSEESRSEFIGQVIRFCDERYHYKKYRISYPEDWSEYLAGRDQLPNIRIFHTKRNAVIMFRILKLEAISGLFGRQKDMRCSLYVTDPDIPEQEGCYTFAASEEGLQIERSELTANQADGIISIADLTERLIGAQGDFVGISEGSTENLEASLYIPSGFDDAALDFWKNLKAIAPIEIPEIV